MPEPTVAEAMSRHVIIAGPDTGFTELIGLLTAHDLCAIPIVDASGRPQGVVTEADLLTKLEYHGGTDNPPLLPGTPARARWRKSSTVIAADLMTTPAITIPTTTPVGAAAHTMATHRSRVLCVVDPHGHLVGVLSGRELLRLYTRSDAAIQTDIERDLDTLARPPHWMTVEVHNAIVTLDGELALRSATTRAVQVVHRVSGVVAVRNNIHFDLDDQMITGM
jgi:CBS-domain-containing membrane protein